MTPEKAIEQHLKQKSENVGAICLKFVSPGTRGVPDRVIISERGIFFVELKRPKGGRLSPHQKRWLREFKRRGHTIHVISTLEEVETFVERYLTPVPGILSRFYSGSPVEPPTA